MGLNRTIYEIGFIIYYIYLNIIKNTYTLILRGECRYYSARSIIKDDDAPLEKIGVTVVVLIFIWAYFETY